MKMSRPNVALFAALAAGTILIGESAAMAETKVIANVIIIDRSGSMQTIRSDGSTRFETAIQNAKDFVDQRATTSIVRQDIAVWSFEGSTYIKHLGFTNNNSTGKTTLKNTLDALLAGGGSTPLAYALCDAVDTLKSYSVPNFTMVTREILLESDGEENNSPSISQCYGPPGTVNGTPNAATNVWTVGSWQWKAWNKLKCGDATGCPSNAAPWSIVMNAAIFDNQWINLAGSTSTLVWETSAKGSLMAPPSSSLIDSYKDFLTQVTSYSGGKLTVVNDSMPAPILGDTNGDYCVDDDDYNLVMANYGFTVPPANPAADINKDGAVNYTDYNIVINNYGLGAGCSGGGSVY